MPLIDAPPRHTLADVFRSQVERRADVEIFAFYDEEEARTSSLTFARLDRQASAIAASLQTEVKVGERALIMAVHEKNFIRAFFACQLAGVIGVPVWPVRLAEPRSLQALQTIAGNCSPLAVLTDLPQHSRQELVDACPELKEVHWKSIDEKAFEGAEEYRPPRLSADSISFLQYTSGSTSAPRGVVVTHRALLANLRMIHTAFSFASDDVKVGWTPLYHDMGLIGNVLHSIYSGIKTVLLSPLAFVQRPRRWLHAMTRHGGTVAGGPNFGYDLCVARTNPEERAELNLSRWRLAFNGAEPVKRSTLDRFSEAFAGAGFDRRSFYPCYGMAENVLLTTGAVPGRGPEVLDVSAEALRRGQLVPGVGQSLVSVGRPRLHRRVEIVDPDNRRRLPPGKIGEIWVAGLDVAPGYWAEGDDVDDGFDARLADSEEGSFLRTGDLGAIFDGDLYVTGRLKDTIIVAGQNHYPQDVEAVVEDADDAIRAGCTAAFAVGGAGTESVVVVAEISSRAKAGRSAQIIQNIERAVARERALRVDEVVLAMPHSIPKTSSGKVQRGACRRAYEGSAIPVWNGGCGEVS